MSGTARLVGHRVEILADMPITGPLPTQTVMSTNTIVGAGYAATRYQLSPTVAQVLASNSQQGIILTPGVAPSTTYLPANNNPSLKTPTSATIATNTLTIAEQAFNGYVEVNLVLATSKVAPLTPVENFEIALSIADNFGPIAVKEQTVPITVPNGANGSYTVVFPVFVPYVPARADVRLLLILVNGQAAHTLTLQTTSVFSFVQLE